MYYIFIVTFFALLGSLYASTNKPDESRADYEAASISSQMLTYHNAAVAFCRADPTNCDSSPQRLTPAEVTSTMSQSLANGPVYTSGRFVSTYRTGTGVGDAVFTFYDPFYRYLNHATNGPLFVEQAANVQLGLIVRSQRDVIVGRYDRTDMQLVDQDGQRTDLLPWLGGGFNGMQDSNLLLLTGLI